VHHRKPSEVFVGIGGFKNMYPLIGKLVKSNLLSLDKQKPGHIFSLIFKLLSTFINLEPQHMEDLMLKRNLIDFLQYFIIKIGQNQMITSELLSELKSVVKSNLLA
jgi:hypothetical protein